MMRRSLKRTRSSVGMPQRRNKSVSPGIKQYVRRAITRASERKFVSTTGVYDVTTTPAIYSIGASAQGINGGQHIGDKCYLKEAHLRFIATCVDTTNLVRVTMFRWKPNMAYITPVAADIYKSVVAGTSLVSEFQEDAADQYEILYDELINLSLASEVTAVRRIRLNNLSAMQDYTSGTASCSNNIYLLMVSDSTAVTHPNVLFYSRTGFTDE